MYRIIVLSMVLISVCCIGNSQNIDTIYPDQIYITHIEPAGDSSFFIVTNRGNLSKVNFDGELEWSKVLPDSFGSTPYPVSVFHGYAADQDSFFYISVFDDQCDVSIGASLLKIDQHGNIELEYEIGKVILEGKEIYPKPVAGRSVFPPSNTLPKYLLKTDDKELIAVYRPDSVILISDFYKINSVGIDSKGGIVVLTSDSLLYYQPDSAGFSMVRKILVPKQIEYSFTFIAATDSTYVLVNDGKIHLYNNTLTTKKTIAADIGENFISAFFHNSIFYAHARSTSLENKVYAFDTDFKRLYKKSVPMTEVGIGEIISFRNENLLISGAQRFGPNNYFPFLKTFTDSIEFEQTGFDIELSGIKYSSMTIGQSDICLTSVLEATYLTNVSVELKNNGHADIHEAYIMPEKAACYPFCDPIYLWNAWVSDLDLAPGETKYVELGDIVIHALSAAVPQVICLYATQPDKHFEIHPEDNRHCIWRTTGLDESLSEKNNPIIFPNPVGDVLQFSTQFGIKHLTVYKIDGTSLIEINEVEKIEASLDVSQLIPGLYFIRCEYDNGYVSSDKFLKL